MGWVMSFVVLTLVMAVLTIAALRFPHVIGHLTDWYVAAFAARRHELMPPTGSISSQGRSNNA